MAVILGTAVAITTFSACIAPLLHNPDDDDDNDFEESKKTLDRTGIIHKPQSSLLTIFLNGLRKIGVISPPTESEKSPMSGSQRNRAKSFPPVVPVVVASRTPRDSPENVHETVPDSLVRPREGSEKRNVMQCVNVNLILSRTTQSTQTEDNYLSAMENFESFQSESRSSEVTTQEEPLKIVYRSRGSRVKSSAGTHHKSSMTRKRSRFPPSKGPRFHTQTNPSTTEDRSTLPVSRLSTQTGSVMTDRRLLPDLRLADQADSLKPYEPVSSQVVPNPSSSSSSAGTQSKDNNLHMTYKILVPRMLKPPRAHPPGTFITGALVHRDASLRMVGQIPNRSCINETPTGRFGALSSHHNYLPASFSSSSLEPPSATVYRHLPALNPSRNQRRRQPEKTISNSSASLTHTVKTSSQSLQTPESRSSANDLREVPAMLRVQTTHPSGYTASIRSGYSAEVSSSSCVTQDLENEGLMERYSTSRRSRSSGNETYRSDRLSRSRFPFLAEASRSNCVMYDLENERSTDSYSTEDMMSSTRVPNTSLPSITEEIPNDSRIVPDDMPYGSHDAHKEDVNSRWDRDIKHVINNQRAYLRRSEHPLLLNDHENDDIRSRELPSQPPVIPFCHNQSDSRTNISDTGTDYSHLHKERKGIAERVREFFRSHGRRKYRRTSPAYHTTFERTLDWKMNRPQQCSTL